MICVYCEVETGTAHDEHETCVEASAATAVELAEPVVLRDDELCHIAADLNGPPWLTLCGVVVQNEPPCCDPDAGDPPCGRPRCPDCASSMERRGGVEGPR